MEIPPESKHWLLAHDKATLRLRRLIWLLAGACALGAVYGFNYRDILAEEHRLLQDFISSESNTEPYRQQLIEAYQSERNPVLQEAALYHRQMRELYESEKEELAKAFISSMSNTEPNQTIESYLSEGQTVDIKTIPTLWFAVRNHIAKNMPSEEFEIEGFKVGVLIALPVLYGPILILGLILCTILQIRKLHTILLPIASPDSEIQLKLNSVYFDRITTRYKQRWRLHVLSFGLIILFLTILGPLIFTSIRTFTKLDTRIEINEKGYITSDLQVDTTPIRFNSEPTVVNHASVLFFISIALWLALILISVRIPHYANKHAQKEMEAVKAGVDVEGEPNISLNKDAP
ncbi:MAG: hypothetical protein CEE38_03110 [Planctomycetes bacterium B3_Pla]|nr:MAG: hypothetical protein CEE38_03110 [Planctomycetes bacterium B3_Pla]